MANSRTTSHHAAISARNTSVGSSAQIVPPHQVARQRRRGRGARRGDGQDGGGAGHALPAAGCGRSPKNSSSAAAWLSTMAAPPACGQPRSRAEAQ